MALPKLGLSCDNARLEVTYKEGFWPIRKDKVLLKDHNIQMITSSIAVRRDVFS